jgi:hypothetical protein
MTKSEGELGGVLEIIGKGVGAVLPARARFVVVVWCEGTRRAQFVSNVDERTELVASLRAAIESLEVDDGEVGK